MNDIHNTLWSALPSNLPPYPSTLPPVRPSTKNQDPPKPSTSPPAVLTEIQYQLHDTQSSLTTHIDRVHSLETVFTENDAIKREVGMLRQLVEKSTARDLEDEEFGAAGGSGLSDDDDARSIRTIIPHEPERIEEEDEHHITKQEQQQEDEDEEERRPRRLESAFELSSSLQAQHATAKAPYPSSNPKFPLESFVQQSQASSPPAAELVPHPDSLTHMLNNWKKSVEGQWSSVREE
ncbi:hypothetical protein PILCRDRAFT_15703 [Piloderma croceum F 1598]|uniref:Uncharacterized protein n=1 Tax=Piloderma croceum (strain F 1598) TaxID=765440 RepID=A0A0C3EYS1_PILCF|nr:hypothetical protein PILCRDRAFT_15703 [Piloderma croceum F 1598]